MIQVSYVALEDGTKAVDGSSSIYAGQPVSINASGKIVPATSGSKIFGLAKVDRNSYEDSVVGKYSIYGSGLMPVLCMGIASIKASTYNTIEVTNAVTSSAFSKDIFDTSKTYAPGDLLYVDANGLISNVAGASKVSALGRVLKVGADELEIEVNPSIITAASELAA